MDANEFSVREAAKRIQRNTAARERARAERRARAKVWARQAAIQLGECDRSLQRVFGFGSTSADEYDFAALGYTIQNLYNAFESYFLRIAKFFENKLDEREWHKSLVHRMTLSVDGPPQTVFLPGARDRFHDRGELHEAGDACVR